MDTHDIPAQLAAETGVLSWPELQRHFARGVVVVVADGLDLLTVAAAMARDDAAALSDWMQRGQVQRATDAHARHWSTAAVGLRAVVVAPWVVVQTLDSDPAHPAPPSVH